jgi:hypothetical protein
MPRLLIALFLLLLLPHTALASSGAPPLDDEPIAEVVEDDATAAPVATPQAAPREKTVYTEKDGMSVSLGNSGGIFFAYPLLKTLSQSYFKLTGIDLGDDKLVDDFAAIHFCSIMKQYYADEFSWRQARDAVRNFISRNLEDYPEHFILQGTINLGRYDFGKKAFLLEGDNEMRRTGVFRISQASPTDCGNYRLQTVPYNFIFRLTNPITLDAIEMPENKAFALTRRMDSDANQTRTVYLSFFLRVNDFSSGVAGAQVASTEAVVRATLLSMRMYYDKARTEMLFEYTGE